MCVNSTKPYMVWNRVLQHGIKSAINACFLGALPIRRLIPPCFCLLLILPCLLFWFTSTTLLLQATLLSWFTYSSSTFTAALLSRTSSPWITSSVFKCLVQETPSIYVKRNTYKTCFRGLICLTESLPPLLCPQTRPSPCLIVSLFQIQLLVVRLFGRYSTTL